MRVLHLSDLHLSRYGETVTWTQREDDDTRGWTPIHVWQRWQVEGARDKRGRPDTLRLVDPEGVVHKVRSWPSRKDDKAIANLLATAMKRHQYSAENLLANPPPEEDVEGLLRLDRNNTNLRLLQIVPVVRRLAPDVLLVTGDLTDNGFGYALVKHYFRPWIKRRRLLVVPGNHDTYDMIPRRGRYRFSQVKERTYLGFAQEVGMAPNAAGLYLKLLGDVAAVGINSCLMPRMPLSASGEVSAEQLDWIGKLGRDPAFREARLRIALVHHHLLRVPFTVGRRNPTEMGMRLRNAVQTMEALTKAGFDIIFNGHRHHGYVVKLPGRPMVISGPSATLGCKHLGRPYAWGLDLGRQQPFPELIDLPREPLPEPGIFQ